MPDDPTKKAADPHAGTAQGVSGPDGGDPANTQQQPVTLPADLSNQLNRMFTDFQKRSEKRQAEIVAKAVTDAISLTFGNRPDPGQPSDSKHDQGGGSPAPAGDIEKIKKELQSQYEKRFSVMEKELAESRAQREKLETERKQEDLLRQFRTEAVSQGVREEMLDLLEAMAYFGPRRLVRRNEEGKPVFMARAEYGDEMIESSISDGLKKFLKTQEGLLFLKPDIKIGAGLHPRKSTGNGIQQKIPALHPAKTPEEAEDLLGKYLQGTLETTG